MKNGLWLGAAAILLLTGCSDDDSEAGEEKAWAWSAVQGTRCGDGSETGIGLNRSEASTSLMIFLEDGGACFNAANCLGEESATRNFEGSGEAELEDFAAERGVQGIFDRDDADNPFRDFDMALVPYCTGDVHIGSRVTDDGLHFVGQENLKLDLPRIKETFPDPDRVYLVGSSAGGFGTFFNYYLVADAFPGVEVHWVDDSGPILPLSAMPALTIVVPTWSLADTLDPRCEGCLDVSDLDNAGLHRLLPHYAQLYPGARGSLISSLQDETMKERFQVQPAVLEASLNELADTSAAGNPDFRVYFIEGDHHTWLDGDETTNKLGDTVSGGVALTTFLQQQLDGDAGWAHVRP